MYFSMFPKVEYRGEDGSYKTITDITKFSRLGTKLLDDVTFYSFYSIQDDERPDHVSQKLYGSVDYYWTFFLMNDNLKNVYEDWPRSSSEFNAYIENKYPYWACMTNDELAVGPETQADSGQSLFSISDDTNDVVEFKDSNATTVATGLLKSKHPSYGYVVVDIIDGDPTTAESIYQDSTGDSVDLYDVTRQYNAPKYWINRGDGDITLKRTAGVEAYTYYQWESELNIKKAQIKVIKPEYIGEVAREFKREMQS